MRPGSGNVGGMADHINSAQGHTTQHDLERIFADYLDPVYRFLYSRVGNREDAEDLTSQVFLKASRRLDGTRTDASVAAWLFTVARTVLADHWRVYYRAPPPVELDEEMTGERSHPGSTGRSNRQAEQLVESVLQALPPRYRSVLELRFLKGYSVNEAAEEMNVAPGNLKVLQHRALARAAELGFSSLKAGAAQDSPADASENLVSRDESEGVGLGSICRLHEKNST